MPAKGTSETAALVQERLAKKERMDDENATAYISAGPIAEDSAKHNASAPAITKESKAGNMHLLADLRTLQSQLHADRLLTE